MTTKSITLDIWKQNDEHIRVNQGEVDSRFLQIKIEDNGQEFSLEGKTAVFFARKPDYNLIFNNCEIVDAKAGILNLAITSQMSLVPGRMRPCEIHILETGKSKLKIKGLTLEITHCTNFDSAIESTSEFTALQKALDEVEDLIEQYSDENIMAKIESMDGEGSGLDADLLDGRHGREYATAEQGTKADLAIQEIKGNGNQITPDEGRIVNITPENIEAVPSLRKVNGKFLTEDIVLNASDVSAAEVEHTHSAADITSETLPVSRGGTGAGEIYSAQSNLGFMKRYKDFSHLSLGQEYTLKDVFMAMANNTYIEVRNILDTNIQVGPVLSGTLKIWRYNSAFGYAEFWGNPNSSGGNFKWVGSLHQDRDFIWNKVYTSNTTVPVENGGTGAKTESEALNKLGAVPSTRKINEKDLSNDITLNASDVSAAEVEHTHSAADITSGALPIENGGTGATNLSDAQKNLQWYNGLTQIGLSNGCSTADIVSALPNSSIFSMSVNGTVQVSDSPADWGQLTVVKSRDRKMILFNQSLLGGANGNNFYFGEHRNTYVTWYKIFTSNPSCTVPIENGGTGAISVKGAQSALKIFTDITQLNLTYPCTTGDIVHAMPDGSIGFFNVEASSATVTDVATGFSFLEIYKATSTRVRVLLNASPSDGSATATAFSIGQYNAGTHTVDKWSRIQTAAFATPINAGGTGATTASGALANLGAAANVHTHSASDITSGTLPIERGGLGATDAYTAQSNLGFMKRYTSLAHLGLPANYKIRDIFSYMEKNTLIELDISTINVSLFPQTQGIARFFKISNNRSYAEFKCTINNGIAGSWVGYYHSDTGFSGWNKIYTSSGVIPIQNGGTGAESADDALTNLKIYTSVESLGLSYPCTSVDIIKKMPINSEVKIAINSKSSSITDLPLDYCLLTIRYNELNRYQIFCTEMISTGSHGLYFGNYVRNVSVTWEKIFTDSQTLSIANGGTGAANLENAQKNLQIYTSVEQLGLIYPCKTSDIIEALPLGSTLNIGFNDKNSSITDAPISYGELSIFYPAQARRLILCNQCISSGGEFTNFYIGYYISSEQTVKWFKIQNGDMTTSIANGGTGATTAIEALTNLGAARWTQTATDVDLDTLKTDGIYELRYTTFDNMNIPEPIQNAASFPVKCLLMAADINATFYQVLFSEWGCYVRRWNQGSVVTSWKQFGGAAAAPLPLESGGTGASTASAALARLGAANANDVGNVSNLSTTAKTVVGAINELYTALTGLINGDEVNY